MPPNLGLETNPFGPTAGCDNAPKSSVGNQQHSPDRRAQTRPQIQGQKAPPNLGSEDNPLHVIFAAALLGIIAQLCMDGVDFRPSIWGRFPTQELGSLMTATGGSSSHLVGRVSAQKVGSDSVPRRMALLMIFGRVPAAPRDVFCAHVWVGGGSYHACGIRPPVSAPRRGRGRDTFFSRGAGSVAPPAAAPRRVCGGERACAQSAPTPRDAYFCLNRIRRCKACS